MSEEVDKRLPHRVTTETGQTKVLLGKVGFQMSPAKLAQKERAERVAREQAERQTIKDAKLKG